jgi:predicted naringenin-chalcone synthase
VEVESAGFGRTATMSPVRAARELNVWPDALTPAKRALPRIAGLATSDSATSFSQEEVLALLGLRDDEFAEGIFARCGVKRRHLSLSEDFLARTLQGRTPQIERELTEHAIRAIDRLGVDTRDIGAVVSSSLYSLGCPTLAHRVVDHYSMAPATDKYHVVGVGCASAVPLMRLASQTLGQHPDKQTLIVAADSMSGILMRATGEDPRAKTIGSAIFGDGCAAALLSRDQAGEGPAIVASQVHQIEGTLDAVSLAFSPHDSYLHLDRALPDLAAADLPAVTASFLARNGLDLTRIDHWIVHPGGRRIIESVQSALGLSDEDCALSWDALAAHGNVGTPSIFYVLKDTVARRAPRPGEHGLVVTIGPGITVGLMLLRW